MVGDERNVEDTGEENEDVVRTFLADNGQFFVESPTRSLGESLAAKLGATEFLRTAPDLHGADGFFAARLRRQ